MGKGIKIGMYVETHVSSPRVILTTPLSIDTGVDYTNPSLGGAFGAGHKVIGGHDFVGDAYSESCHYYCIRTLLTSFTDGIC